MSERWLEREREQLALWIPVGLGAGISAWFALPNPFAWLACCCGCAALALGALLLPEGMRLRRVLILTGLLGIAGCLIVWGKAMVAGEPPIARGAYVALTATVRSVEPLPAQGTSRLMVDPLGRADLPGRIRVNVRDKDWNKDVAAGAVIAFRARLMPPAPPAVPGAYDFARRAYFLGIGATGRALPPIKVLKASASPGPTLRQRLSDHIRSRVSGGEGAIAATLATGDRGAISAADDLAMRRSGLAHLLSISGLHVSALVGAVIFLLFRLMALSRRVALHLPLMLIAALGGAAAGIGYTLLTGADVPTVRSCVAALLVLGGLALGREAITLRLVAAGALFVLLLWPEAVVGPSFQMSFAAVTAIVAVTELRWFRALTHGRDESGFLKVGRGLLSLFLTGIAVELVLAPIALFHFHKAGMLGSLANLVAIPLTTFVVMPFEALALVLDIAGLGAPAWWVVQQGMGLLLWVAHHVAASPNAVALAPAFSVLAFAMTSVGTLWCLLWRTRARLLGFAPLAAGLAMIVTAPSADILVTGDGRHVAIRTQDGGMAVLRDKAGDYVRDTLSESAGYGGALTGFADLRQARCSDDLCAVTLAGGRRLLATRSFERVDAPVLARECAAADIVVSERRLPRSCRARWLRLDKASLARTGGVAIFLRDNAVRTARTPTDAHPWVAAPALSTRRRGARPGSSFTR